jgi:hypothetical protein
MTKKKKTTRKRQAPAEDPMKDMMSITRVAVGGTMAVTTLGVMGGMMSNVVPKGP